MRRAISLAKSISISTRMSQFAHFGGRFQFGSLKKNDGFSGNILPVHFFFHSHFILRTLPPTKNLKIFVEKMIHHQCRGSSVKREMFHCTTAFIFSLSIKGMHYGGLIIIFFNDAGLFLIVYSWCNVLFQFCFSVYILFTVSCCFKWSSLRSVFGGGLPDVI